jgi:hypothetical protein
MKSARERAQQLCRARIGNHPESWSTGRQFYPITTGILGGIERGISAFDQFVRTFHTAKLGNTDGNRYPTEIFPGRLAADMLGGNGLANLLRHGNSAIGHSPGQDDREFLTPVARRCVMTFRTIGQALGHQLDDLITQQMPMGVVELLEMIYVEHQEREFGSAVLGFINGPL